MSSRRRESSIARAPVEPSVSTLHVGDGVHRDGETPFAGILAPPIRTARGREKERFLFLFAPTDTPAPRLGREIRQIVRKTYWSTPGSITAALRRTASVANRYLLEHNLNAKPADRCYGGLSCAVFRDNDIFLLQAGPAWACVLQGDQLRCFPRGERLAHMGIGAVADVRLHHVFAAAGDTLLLAPTTLLRKAGAEGLHRVLPRDEVDSVLAGLSQLGTDSNFVALVARCEAPRAVEALHGEAHSEVRRPRAQLSSGARPSSTRAPENRESAKGKPQTDQRRASKPKSRTEKQTSIGNWRRSRLDPRFNMRQKLGGILKQIGAALRYIWHGIAAVGTGLFALARWLLGIIAVTIQGIRPGAARQTRRRVRRRQPPEENRAVMMAVAIAIPVVVIILVTLAYVQFAGQSRFQDVIRQAEEQIALAQAAGPDSEEARVHWEEALQRAEAAATLQPEDSSVEALLEDARRAIDQLDHIERLTFTLLLDFGSRNPGRHLVLYNEMVFVLDPKDDWGAEVKLNRIDGASERETHRVLVHAGQQLEGDDVGSLVDFTWVGREGGRQSSALLVLEEEGKLLSYDPAWQSEDRTPQLIRLELAPLPTGTPIAVGSYQGRFYVMGASPEDAGQIWRYIPRSNSYPDPPESYFTRDTPQDLEKALDMAIDGYIYILYDDGTVRKFLGGEPQPFEIRDVPGRLEEISAFAVDPNGNGAVYLADKGNSRIVKLAPDGRFQTQFRASKSFVALEALAVDQAEREIYVLDNGRLYKASLP